MTRNGSFLGAYWGVLRQRAFAHAYHSTFKVIRADTDELVDKALSLRHEVYCRENNFLEPGHFPDGRESDVFDTHSLHFLLVHKDSRETVGTLRLVLPTENHPLTSFPLQRLCDHPLLQIENRVMGLCQISRFCMSPSFRRRAHDGMLLPAYSEQEWNDDKNRASRTPFFRRRIPWAPLGLIGAAFEAALRQGINDCIMTVETELLPTMRRLGIPFRLLAPPLETQGGRQPVIFNIKSTLDLMLELNPECWEVVSDKGRRHHLADDIFSATWKDAVPAKPGKT